MATERSFDKFYFADTDSERLKLPPAFVTKIYSGHVPTTVLLQTRCKTSFQVHTEVVDGEYFWTSGWPSLLECHVVRHHDHMVFEMVEPTKFIVKLSGAKSCLCLASLEDDAEPKFTCVFTKTNISRRHITIPSQFWDTYLREKVVRDGASVQLCRENTVHFGRLAIQPDRVKIQLGWTDMFLRTNSITVGSSATFYLTRVHPLVFRFERGH